MSRRNRKIRPGATVVVPKPTPASVPSNLLPDRPSTDFGLLTVRKTKVKQSQATVLRDVTGKQERNFSRMTGEQIIRIIQGTDLSQIRELSKYFLRTNGIYARAVQYLANLYRFDYMVYPNLDLAGEMDEKTNTKILKKYDEVLSYFDTSAIQAQCRKWANQICIEGTYYGYITEDINDKLIIQDLPTNYCRSRFTHRGKPVVEFNVKYFDQVTSDPVFREQLLNLFPEEIKAGYKKQLAGRLPAEVQGDDSGWILLDIKHSFKFNFYDSDVPPFIYAIPALINLTEVQDLEKEKLLQTIQKILIQRFELDKQGQIPFTMTELQRLNQNAVDTVGDAVGVSVLSTVAEVHLEDVASDGGEASKDNADAAEGNVYNDLGISRNLFNSEGNLSLEKSIITDQSFVRQLIYQFEFFFNDLITWKFNKPTLKFKMKMLDTTIFNYVEISDKYKDLTKIGFSRFLPMAALGHETKEVTSLAKVEQQLLNIDSFMLPPFSSNTMSSATWSQIKEIQRQILNGETSDLLPEGISQSPTPQSNSGIGAAQGASRQAALETAETAGGRPPLPNDKKSDKTIANISAN